MGAPEDGTVPLLNGRLRDPALYVLTLIAFGLGGGGGWLVAVDGVPHGKRSEPVALLRQQVDSHIHRRGVHTDGEQLRAIMQHEIDRSLRPIERELSAIRATLHRVQNQLDRALARATPSHEPAS